MPKPTAISKSPTSRSSWASAVGASDADHRSGQRRSREHAMRFVGSWWFPPCTRSRRGAGPRGRVGRPSGGGRRPGRSERCRPDRDAGDEAGPGGRLDEHGPQGGDPGRAATSASRVRDARTSHRRAAAPARARTIWTPTPMSRMWSCTRLAEGERRTRRSTSSWPTNAVTCTTDEQPGERASRSPGAPGSADRTAPRRRRCRPAEEQDNATSPSAGRYWCPVRAAARGRGGTGPGRRGGRRARARAGARPPRIAEDGQATSRAVRSRAPLEAAVDRSVDFR